MFNSNPASQADNVPPSMGTVVNPSAQPLLRATRAPSQRQHLGFPDLREMTNAMRMARHLGRPLNRHLTVWWTHSRGFDPSARAWIEHQGRYLKALMAWLLHRGVPSHYIAVREWGDVKRAHSHVMLHVPANLAEAFNDFAVLAGNFEGCPDGIDNRPVVMSGGWPWEETGAETPAQQAGLIRYSAKDISPKHRVGGVLVAEALEIIPQHNTQLIEGKRLSVHRNIGKAARQEAGFPDLSTLAEVRAALPTGEDAKRERRQKARVNREDAHV